MLVRGSLGRRLRVVAGVAASAALASASGCLGSYETSDAGFGGEGGEPTLADGTGGRGGDDGDGGVGGAPDLGDAFITVWDTQAEGALLPTISASDTIVLPLAVTGTYDMLVSWGDGTRSEITNLTDPDRIHRYAEPGTYVVSMVGVIEGWRAFHDECTAWKTDEFGTEYCVARGSDSPSLCAEPSPAARSSRRSRTSRSGTSLG